MVKSNERLTRLRAEMAANGIDLLAVGPTANMRYLLGFAPYPDERLTLLLVRQDDARIVVPSVNAENVAAGTDLPLVIWQDEDGPGDAVRDALAARAVDALAIDGATRSDFLLPLLEIAAPMRVISAGGLLGALRERKSPAEVEALVRVAAQADRAMAAAVAACVPGATEAEVAWAAERAFRLDGAEQVQFTLVASGPNGAFPHHHSGPRKLQVGDAIVVDIGATLDGYQSDITRTVYLGEPPEAVARAYEAVLAANVAGRGAVRPGVTAGDVDRATRAVLEEAGLGEFFVHRTGHGIGLEVHEPPWIIAGSEVVLEEGMTFSIEPGVYLPGEYGIRVEDIVAVTADGVRTLTGYDHGLVVKG